MKTEIFDNLFLSLMDPDQEPQALVDGLTFCEGPVWSPREECLYFNDIPHSKTWRYSDEHGVELAFDNEHRANGMCLNGQGELLLCEQDTSSLVRRNTQGGARQVLASHHGQMELNSPNDVVVRSDGLCYFTDPIYGRRGTLVPAPRPLPSDLRPVYCYHPKTQDLRPVADHFESPNGLCFSPDEQLLYVNDTTRHHIKVFDVKEDGTLENERIFVETAREEEIGTGPDGMKVDSLGNILCACLFAGLQWYSPQGQRLGVVHFPEKVLNLAFGGQDLRDLFVTCEHHVYRIRAKVGGPILPKPSLLGDVEQEGASYDG